MRALAIIGLFVAVGCGPSTPATKDAKPAPRRSVATALQFDCSAEAQQHRKNAMQATTEAGIFSKIEAPPPPHGDLPNAWTGPLWNEIPFAMKQNSVRAIFAYYCCATQSDLVIVTVYDQFTGKELGRFTKHRELVLD